MLRIFHFLPYSENYSPHLVEPGWRHRKETFDELRTSRYPYKTFCCARLRGVASHVDPSQVTNKTGERQMRRAVIRFICLLGLLVTAAGCSDAPTAPNMSERPKIDVGNAGIIGSVFLDPVIVRGCDPTITECEDDAGWDSCAAGELGTSAPEMGSIEGCGGGGSGAGGDGGGPGSGGGGDGTPSEPVCPDYGCLTPFEEGPFLWAACVLALVGGGYSVETVGQKFVGWYDAHKALVSARQSLDVTLQMQRAGYVIDPAMIELSYHKVELATQRRDDAVGAVEEATGVSVLTLVAAGLTCGAAAAAPTP